MGKKSRVITGNLVVEDGTVSIQGEDGNLTALTKDNTVRIECRNGDTFQVVSLWQIISNYEKYGWSIYAGTYSLAEVKGE